MKPLLFAMPGNEAFTGLLDQAGGFEMGALQVRRFPDQECYVRVASDIAGRNAAVVCTLAHPDAQFLGLWYTAKTMRELGAKRIALVAPYLAYMRQDKRFQSGEAVTSKLFAELIGQAFDCLITADPHLHRFHSLSELYSIPARSVEAAPMLAEWIGRNVDRPVIIGPDEESEQWAASVARAADAPYVVLSKSRYGDRDVRITFSRADVLHGRTPVLIDDIISSGRTMREVTRHLLSSGYARPICVAVHGVFDGAADAELRASGVADVITTNTIPHTSAGIDISGLFAAPLLQQLGD